MPLNFLSIPLYHLLVFISHLSLLKYLPPPSQKIHVHLNIFGNVQSLLALSSSTLVYHHLVTHLVSFSLTLITDPVQLLSLVMYSAIMVTPCMCVYLGVFVCMEENYVKFERLVINHVCSGLQLGRLCGLSVVCWTTDHYHLSSNLGVGISEWCFIFDIASLALEVVRPI